MATLQVDSLRFIFQPSISAQKYDDSQHYRTVCQQRGQTAVDIVAMKMVKVPNSAWLIEAKDFRFIHHEPKPCNLQGLAQTIATKVTDTLAGLKDAAESAVDQGERQHAARAVVAINRQIVLHLEPHEGQHSRLFPTNFSSGVLQKLRQLVKGIDPKPMVLKISNTSRAGVPWAVS